MGSGVVAAGAEGSSAVVCRALAKLLLAFEVAGVKVNHVSFLSATSRPVPLWQLPFYGINLRHATFCPYRECGPGGGRLPSDR